MKITKARVGTPHRFPIGYQRTINNERCTLISYTVRNRPKYRGPSGVTYTFYERMNWRKA